MNPASQHLNIYFVIPQTSEGIMPRSSIAIFNQLQSEKIRIYENIRTGSIPSISWVRKVSGLINIYSFLRKKHVSPTYHAIREASRLNKKQLELVVSPEFRKKIEIAFTFLLNEESKYLNVVASLSAIADDEYAQSILDSAVDQLYSINLGIPDVSSDEDPDQVRDKIDLSQRELFWSRHSIQPQFWYGPDEKEKKPEKSKKLRELASKTIQDSGPH